MLSVKKHRGIPVTLGHLFWTSFEVFWPPSANAASSKCALRNLAECRGADARVPPATQKRCVASCRVPQLNPFPGLENLLSGQPLRSALQVSPAGSLCPFGPAQSPASTAEPWDWLEVESRRPCSPAPG